VGPWSLDALVLFSHDAPTPRQAGSRGPDKLVLPFSPPSPLNPRSTPQIHNNCHLRSMVGVSSGNPSLLFSCLMSFGSFVLLLACRGWCLEARGGRRRTRAGGEGTIKAGDVSYFFIVSSNL
jgi:hypothetical protein